MYKKVSNKVSFTELEKEVLDFWKKENIFEESLAKNKTEHVFYDGPPFPTGNPHHGTIFVSVLKDSIARYKTQAGYSVPRKWGWDCHGQPIENITQENLKLTNKNEIENIGVAKFNDECRKVVSNCNDNWEEYISKIGRWVDYKNPYRTLDKNYMESVLWVFQESFKKDLIYKDYRVTPYCTHCETSLSISDTRESDSTRPKQDPEVIVRFKATDDIQGLPTYYLAWTTTPWTLTANMALAIGSKFTYVALKHEGAIYVMAKDLVGKHKKLLVDAEVIKEFLGEELLGKTYEPIFPYYKHLDCFKLIDGAHVTTSDGVGIVHTAPAFGEDDYWICRKNNIKVQNPVDESGCFMEEVTDFVGRHVLEANKDVIKKIKEDGNLLQHQTIEHNYPHCWRCRNPLIYRAMDSWYFAVEKIKDKLIKNNEEIKLGSRNC